MKRAGRQERNVCVPMSGGGLIKLGAFALSQGLLGAGAHIGMESEEDELALLHRHARIFQSWTDAPILEEVVELFPEHRRIEVHHFLADLMPPFCDLKLVRHLRQRGEDCYKVAFRGLLTTARHANRHNARAGINALVMAIP